MKKLFYTAILLLLVSCSKSYLEEPKPTAAVSSQLVFGSKSRVESFISGILRYIRGQYGKYDTGGLYSLYMARSVKGKDIIDPDGWYSYDYALRNREPSYRRTEFNWKFLYVMIGQVNALIKGVKESTGLSEADKKQLAAQAYALRGFFYFQLAQEFQLTYTKDPNAAAPPIYTEPTQKAKPMSTLKKMYALIVSDLTQAVKGLDASRLGKSYVNKNVAEGILARVYQVMGKWSEAEKMAHDAYGGVVKDALDAASYRNGFNAISSKEWIWGMPQRGDQSNYYYLAPAAFTDHDEDPSAGVYIDKAFVETFSDTDVRKLFRENTDPKAQKWQVYTTTKFKFSFDADMVLMRTAEMILIEAEAKFQQGKEADAHALLYKLQQNRDPDAVKSGNTGGDLLDEILLERRKELYLEIGTEWYDARRLQRGIKRDANHPGNVEDLTSNDNRFYLKIPQSEIDANPEIDASVNANR